MATYGPGEATCAVLTFAEGVLSSLAHDLVFRVGAFAIDADPAAPRVTAWFDATSLRVAAAMHGGKVLRGALSAADVRKIERQVVDDVLHAQRHPRVEFASTAVEPDGEGGYRLAGALTLAGATREITAHARREAGRLRTEVEIDQPLFGIRPFVGLFGAIRIQPRVLVRLAVPAPPADRAASGDVA